MKTYEGLLSLHDHGESDDVLFLSSLTGPLADELSWMAGKNITARYWITDKKVTKEEANNEFMKIVMGIAYVDFDAKYSELTGYLWTDEDLNVGGHDLMEEFRSSVGKWLILEIKE